MELSRPVFENRLPKKKPVVRSAELATMARPRAKPPARRYHISDQSIVKVDGKDFYLDKYNRPESTAR